MSTKLYGGELCPMRGDIPKKKYEEINNQLPRIDKKLIFLATQGLLVDIYDLANNKHLGIALVCLDDARQRFEQVIWALHEAAACIVYYREIVEGAPKEMTAIATAKFYADYAALLLYAAAEDLSFFIIQFMEIAEDIKIFLKDPKVAKRLEKMNVSSNAAKVGFYLKNKRQNHEITNIALALHQNKDWKEIITYRNAWVHDKPPIVMGTGIQYDRQTRVEIIDQALGLKAISFGGGAPHRYNIDELLASVQLAAKAFASALSALTPLLLQVRENLGEKIDFENESE